MQDAFMTTNELLENILNALPVGIMFCDEKCRIRFINKEYAAILGKEIDEILGKEVKELIPKSRVPDVLGSGKDELGDLCLIPGKDKLSSAVVNRILLRSRQGEQLGVVSHAIFSKVSDLHELADKFTEKISQMDKKLLNYQRRMQSAFRYQYDLNSILGNNAALLEQKKLLARYALVDSPVLILGETGTGKELFAHALHAESQRSKAPLVSINCAAIPKELFESELFGYAEGAFSGAHKDGKIGQVEFADEGTLFLDEIGDLSLDAQSKLLRFLEDKTVCRVGSVSSRKIDFRLVCATNKNLTEMVVNGRFREDLYYRISPLQIIVPPLRQRKDDIPLLISHFIQQSSENLRFSDRAMNAMTTYSWPGNIRALRNAITHAASICTTSEIDYQHLPAWFRERNEFPQLKRNPEPKDDPGETAQPNKMTSVLSHQERALLTDLLRKNGGNISQVAKELGVCRATIYNKFKRLGLDHRMAMRKL
jgi:transcriptional regulator with PAS, ATPase and Fis domain